MTTTDRVRALSAYVDKGELEAEREWRPVPPRPESSWPSPSRSRRTTSRFGAPFAQGCRRRACTRRAARGRGAAAGRAGAERARGVRAGLGRVVASLRAAAVRLRRTEPERRLAELDGRLADARKAAEQSRAEVETADAKLKADLAAALDDGADVNEVHRGATVRVEEARRVASRDTEVVEALEGMHADAARRVQAERLAAIDAEEARAQTAVAQAEEALTRARNALADLEEPLAVRRVEARILTADGRRVSATCKSRRAGGAGS